MAGIDLGVVGQAEQPLDDVRAELLVTAPREVGAADAAAEECVSREDPTFYLGIEADTAHGMTRRADDLKGALPYFDDLAVFQVNIGQVAIARERKAKHRSLLT